MGKEKSLLIARDRYGVKPLYFFEDHKTVLFGSEQKPILEHAEFEQKINKRALLEYFTFQNIFTDQTLLEGIKLLPSGHYGVLKMAAKSPSLQTFQYWDYQFREPDKPICKHEYEDELDRFV